MVYFNKALKLQIVTELGHGSRPENLVLIPTTYVETPPSLFDFDPSLRGLPAASRLLQDSSSDFGLFSAAVLCSTTTCGEVFPSIQFQRTS